MEVDDVVTLTDATGEHTGKVTKILDEDGMVAVTWNTGVTERIHESELVGASSMDSTGPGLPPWEPKMFQDELARANPDEEAYEPDNPKHPTFRERLSALWDSRPGK